MKTCAFSVYFLNLRHQLDEALEIDAQEAKDSENIVLLHVNHSVAFI
ncbi:11757_t:CDS:2 [Rhizophagus irregularis]|nr:11757_t:CDS:2 [Rhizophagus irregularis]